GAERKVLPYCTEREIPVVAYSPFGQSAFPKPGSKAAGVLGDVARKHGKTPRQVALNYLTRHPNVFAIPKSGNPEHTRENAGALGWDLEAADVAAIEKMFPAPDRDRPLAML